MCLFHVLDPRAKREDDVLYRYSVPKKLITVMPNLIEV